MHGTGLWIGQTLHTHPVGFSLQCVVGGVVPNSLDCSLLGSSGLAVFLSSRPQSLKQPSLYSYNLQIWLITSSSQLFGSGVVMAPCCFWPWSLQRLSLNLLNPTYTLVNISFIKLSSVALSEHALLSLLRLNGDVNKSDWIPSLPRTFVTQLVIILYRIILYDIILAISLVLELN